MAKNTKSKTKGLFREGRKLVIREGARFSPHCVICGRFGDVEPVDFTFSRAQAHVVEAAVVQSAARAMSDLATGTRYTGPVYAAIPLCGWCRGRRMRVLGVGLGLIAVAVGGFLIQRALGIVIIPPGELGFLEMSVHNFIACGMILVGCVMTLMATLDSSNLWFKATKFYDRYVWVAGAGSGFVAQLPWIDNHHQSDRGGTSEERSRSAEAHLSADELIRRANLDDDE